MSKGGLLKKADDIEDEQMKKFKRLKRLWKLIKSSGCMSDQKLPRQAVEASDVQ